MLRKLVCEIVAAGIIMCGFGEQAVFAAGEEVEHVFSPSVTAEQSAATETPEVIDETEVIEEAPLDISRNRLWKTAQLIIRNPWRPRA